MDTQKHLTEENVLENIVGQTFDVRIVAHLDEEKKFWSAVGNAKFSVTENGNDWAEAAFSVKSLDRHPENAFATIMLAISNFMDGNGINELSTQLKDIKAND